MRWIEQRERFRKILFGSRCTFPACVFDPVSARIAEDLGYESGMISGSVVSTIMLGAPDLIVLSLSELAEQTYRTSRVCKLPILVDADHGYGNALNVIRTVEELERAGAAALTIEDTLLPKAFGHSDKTQLISVEEGVGKMRAALAARRDPGLAIVGRTSAITIAGIDEAVARIKAYAATGIDAIFLVNARKREELEAVSSAVQIPIILANVGGEHEEEDYLSAKGVKVCFEGHAPFMAAVQALYTSLKALREGTPPSKVENVASGALMKRVAHDELYNGWMQSFLR
jgi:carboxyvinyl-carboxyphosphonate phosphorylmutase